MAMQRFFKHNKNIIISLLAFFLLLAAAPETLPAQKLPELIPYRKGDKWGFADSTKKIVITAIYRSVTLFEGDVAIVRNENGSGLIDKTGKLLIEHKKHGLQFVPENMILASITDKKDVELYGLFNRQGILKIPFKYYSLDFPSEGICLYRDKKHKVGYVDTNGKVVATAKYYSGGKFKSGRASVEWAYAGCNKGYIDRNGKEVIPLVNERCDDFVNGFAITERCGGPFVIFDTSGKAVQTLPAGTYFSAPLAKMTPIQYKGKYGYLDSTFQFAIPAIYESAEPFGEGFAVVSMGSGKKGLINKKGKAVVPFQYSLMKAVDSGCVVAGNFLKEGRGIKYTLLDTQGHVILSEQYDRIEPMSEGLVGACKDGKCGYYDLKGEIVVPLQYTQADRFNNGMALVYINRKPAVIDRKGNYIIPFKYDGLGRFENGLFKAYIKDKEFYVDRYGNEYYEEE